MSQGSDDGHALAGANSEADLAASENSVINMVFCRRGLMGICGYQWHGELLRLLGRFLL